VEERPDRLARALARTRRFVASYVAKGPYALYPDEAVVENVVQGLARNLVDHGKMVCPCAPAGELDLVCPCAPHHADIARQGHCDCALFASREFLEAEKLRQR
jgi:ferredoxin-thioredoxin reductase catalytic subunit